MNSTDNTDTWENGGGGVNSTLTKDRESPEPAATKRKPRREYHKHGVSRYRRLLSGDGLKQSTGLYHALRNKELELVQALGGDPSPQERAIIADTIKHMLFAGSLDRYLLGLKSLVRRGKVHSVVGERTRIGAHIRENLKTLGLKRVQKTLSLDEILSEDEEQT
jgi:hypothetical protein